MRIEREGGSFVTLDGAGGTRRRLPGGVFIMTMKQRAPAVDFKAVMKRSGEIDKALKKQLEARGPAPPRKRTKVDHQSLGGGGGGGRGGGRGRRGEGGAVESGGDEAVGEVEVGEVEREVERAVEAVVEPAVRP